MQEITIILNKLDKQLEPLLLSKLLIGGNMKLTIEQTSDELRQMVDRVVNYTFEMDLTWEWPGGVAFYGVSRAYDVTGEKAYLERAKDWLMSI